MTAAVSTRGLLLFAAMSVLWGMPYLFIREAVDTFSPAAVVAIRTLGAGLLLLPLAIRAGALRPAWAHIGWVLAFGAVEMAAPFILLANAEQTLDSGLTGLLVATVPLFGAISGYFLGDRGILQPARWGGLLLGFSGVAVIVIGPATTMANLGSSLYAVAQVLLVAVLYALGPFIVAHKLRGVPSLGTITLSLLAVGVVYLPIGLLTQDVEPSARSVWSVVALTVLCTAVAFLAFFALIAEVGPARAPLFTYINPVIAIILGILILNEPLSFGLLIGFPLVIVGCWLAATGGRLRAAKPLPTPPVAPG